MPDGATNRAGRARIPYVLIALVFAPLAVGYFVLLRNVEGSASRTRARWR